MAKSAGQKLKLLYLERLLMERTDDDHGVTVQEMIDYLAAFGISAERKSIYDDLELLKSAGCDIQRRKEKTWVYSVGQRPFQMAELQLLVDAVQSSRFITRKKNDELIHKLEGLASRYQAGALQRQVVVAGRIKTMNESIYYNIDALHGAISAGRQVTFLYYDWTVDKKRHYRHEGARYRVSPFTLVWNDEYYYLVAYDAESGILRNYRVDRMREIRTEDEKRLGEELYHGQDPSYYTQRVFDMYSGEVKTITLRFTARLAGSVLDRFGSEIHLADNHDGTFDVTVRLVPSPRFYGWLFGFGTDAALVGPQDARLAYEEFARQTFAHYAEV